MKLLEKLFIGTKEVKSSIPSESEKMTRGELLEKIYEHFLLRFKEETTSEGMLFPASFTIFLNSDDYDKREQTFGITVKELINKCNRFILSEAKKYDEYVPHAEFWQFQFVSYQKGNFIEGFDGVINPRDVIVSSTIFPTTPSVTDISDVRNRTVTTVHSKDSISGKDWAINKDALGNVSMLSKDRFTVPFNNFRKLKQAPQNDFMTNDPINNANAVLQIIGAHFIKNDSKSDTFHITENHILISGPDGEQTYGGLNVAHIDNSNVKFNHMQIRRNSDSNLYSIRVLAPVMLNEVAYEADRSLWLPLPDNSCISIAEFDIKFKIIH